MTFKKVLFLFLVWAIATPMMAQTIVNRVVNTTGGTGKIGTVVFDYAVGEPITATLTDTKNFVTQGFLQPELRTNGLLYVTIGQDCEFGIFPNPTRAELNSFQDIRGRVFEIFNTLGQSMGQFTTGNGNTLDVSYFASGTYYIRLFCDQTHFKVLKFVKFN